METTRVGNLTLHPFFCILPATKLRVSLSIPTSNTTPTPIYGIRCQASESGGGGKKKKVSSRLSQMQKILKESEERSLGAESEPTPRLTLGKVKFHTYRHFHIRNPIIKTKLNMARRQKMNIYSCLLILSFLVSLD